MIRRYYAATLGAPDYILDMPIFGYHVPAYTINITCTLSRSIGVDLAITVKVDYTPIGGTATTVNISVTILAGNTAGSAAYAVPGSPSQINVTRDGILSYTPTTYNTIKITDRAPY